jgi:predicted esterase
MHAKWLPTLVFGISLGIIGCGSSTVEPPGATGGSASGGSTGGTATGGAATGGAATGGKATGGAATGGAATGGAATGGAATGGSTGGAATGGKGGAASGGSGGGTSTGGSAGGSGGGDKSAPAPSKGCGMMDGAKTLTMGGSSVMSGLATSTRLKITAGGMNREYIIDIPADYDPNHPYRLIFSWYQAYGSDTGNANGLHPADDGPNFNAQNYAFYGLHREATNAKQPSIFVAPGGMGNLPWDFTRDLPLFDALLQKIGDNLCIDNNRVFSTGFSFGAMMTYALSITRQTKLRGVVAMAPANYNLPGEPKDSNEAPIAYMGTTGMSDTTCKWGDENMGGKACAVTHAKDNGCNASATIPTATVGSKKYVCYDFEGCKAGYPVKVCTFDGPHTPSRVCDGSTNGDDGLKAFIPPIAWKFIAQF